MRVYSLQWGRTGFWLPSCMLFVSAVMSWRGACFPPPQAPNIPVAISADENGVGGKPLAPPSSLAAFWAVWSNVALLTRVAPILCMTTQTGHGHLSPGLRHAYCVFWHLVLFDTRQTVPLGPTEGQHSHYSSWLICANKCSCKWFYLCELGTLWWRTTEAISAAIS